MKKCIFKMLFLAFVLGACNNAAPAKEEPVAPAKSAMVQPVATPTLKKLDFAVKKDLVCGMPVSAGISDTFRYKDKLYGFCSPECKEEFVKLPGQYIASTSK